MEGSKRDAFRERLGVSVGTGAIITSVFAVIGLIVWFAIVAGYEGSKRIRAWINTPPAAPFAKKQECSKFLNDPKLSTLLPSLTAGEIAVNGHTWHNVVRDSPIVIYSGILDSCIGIQPETGILDNRPYGKVITVDLLTGEIVGNRTSFGIENQRKWGPYEGNFEQFFNDPRNRDTILEMKRTAAPERP